MKAGLVTSAVRRNGCAAYAVRLGKIRLLMTPYVAGKGRLFAQMSPGLRHGSRSGGSPGGGWPNAVARDMLVRSHTCDLSCETLGLPALASLGL